MGRNGAGGRCARYSLSFTRGSRWVKKTVPTRSRRLRTPVFSKVLRMCCCTVFVETARRTIITNVLTSSATLRDSRLYAQRWDIEMAVKTVKTDLSLHLLWSSMPAVIRPGLGRVDESATTARARRRHRAGQSVRCLAAALGRLPATQFRPGTQSDRRLCRRRGATRLHPALPAHPHCRAGRSH
ncbi:MAG: hypothetical protein QOJ59_5473 [Thermomicrobiales bacterium]|nr:hypothetical protein [Thermomicrobiales bacterium]